MLRDIARQLDDWVAARNREARADGLPVVRPCSIRVMGQTALLEAHLPLALVATRDVDVKADYEFSVESEFKRLLRLKGRDLDPLGHEVWMPRETQYTALYAGRSVELSIADAECVLLSKALKAPAKNRVLILEYLASGPSERFLALAKKYRVNLEQFL